MRVWVPIDAAARARGLRGTRTRKPVEGAIGRLPGVVLRDVSAIAGCVRDRGGPHHAHPLGLPAGNSNADAVRTLLGTE